MFATTTIPGTLLPTAFLAHGGVSGIVSSRAAAQPCRGGAAVVGMRTDETPCLPPVAVEELPRSAFTAAELDTTRLCATLPPEFELVPTPHCKTHVNLSKVTKGNLLRVAGWQSNLYRLVMSAQHRPLIGRYLRVASEDAWRYFELPFLAYSIRFHRDVLLQPDVEFTPLFVAPPAGTAANFWARRATDDVAPRNHVPMAPPGAVMPFERLPRANSVDHARKARLRKRGRGRGGEADEDADADADADDDADAPGSASAAHPVMRGVRLFPHMGDAPRSASYQDGGVGMMVYRLPADVALLPEVGVHAAGQTVVLYVRVAFSRAALDPVDAQLDAVNDAVNYALGNTLVYRDAAGAPQPYVRRHPHFPQTHAACAAATFETDVTSVNAVTPAQHARVLLAHALAAAGGCDVSHALRCAGPLLALPDRLAPGVPHVDVLLDNNAGVLRVTAAEHALVQVLAASARAEADALAARFRASQLLYDLAPPDPGAFGAAPVVVVGVPLAVRTFAPHGHVDSDAHAARRRASLNDLVTRFMYDVMLALPTALVQPPRDESLLAVMTEKAPGILDVEQAITGQPKRVVTASVLRRQVNPHPELPPGFKVERVAAAAAAGRHEAAEYDEPPPLTRAQVDANPLLQHTLAGPLLPSAVPGTQVSVYAPNSKCHGTSFSGTSHSWVNVGAFVANRLTEPHSAKANPCGLFVDDGYDNDGFDDDDDGFKTGPSRTFCARAAAAVNLLWAPFYNVTHNEVWKSDGVWSTPRARCRQWKKAYGVTVDVLHAAMFWQLYPAFEAELRSPATLDIWRLKQACEAELQWMSRIGRVIRLLLNQARRKRRSDFELVLRNYHMLVQRANYEDAPTLPLCLSAMNTFQHHLLLGKPLQSEAEPNIVFRRAVALKCAAAPKDDDDDDDVGLDAESDAEDAGAQKRARGPDAVA
jgi:hypothetical protein